MIDVYSRECLAIEVGSRLRGEDVTRVLHRLVYLRGAPQALFVDNGAEFTGQIVDLWAYHHKVKMDFSRSGTPTDNAHIESFIGSLRDGPRERTSRQDAAFHVVCNWLPVPSRKAKTGVI